MVITAVHTLVYADDAEAARAFFRDVLGLPYIDTGHNWLIFRTGASELGVHPVAGGDGPSGGIHHEITLMCDDIEATVAELTAKGARFTRDVRNDGFGLTTEVEVPGAGALMIYQPLHPQAHTL